MNMGDEPDTSDCVHRGCRCGFCEAEFHRRMKEYLASKGISLKFGPEVK